MVNSLLSVHDVMPTTLGRVEDILRRLDHFPRDTIYLLVVPGLDWEARQIERLRELQGQGYQLAGHGLIHHANRIRGLYHRLHSRLISKQVAEHLALDEAGISRLIESCYAWFRQQGLQPPTLYVPPAWAMGSISRTALERLPFRWYEYLHGIYDARHQRFHRLPLAGFEADNRLQKYFLGFWNRVNARRSSSSAPLRFSIHPSDFSLQLQSQLETMLHEWSLDCRRLEQLPVTA